MPAGDRQQNKGDGSDLDVSELTRLLSLYNTPVNNGCKPQRPSLKYVESNKKNSPSPSSPSHQPTPPSSWSAQQSAIEADILKKFSLKYKNERQFSSHPHYKLFLDLCSALTKHRLCSQPWLSKAPAESVLHVLRCLRILLRDPSFQTQFCTMNNINSLTEYFCRVTDEYLYSTDGPFTVEILKEMTNIFQKLSASVDRCELLVRGDAHKPLVRLLTATDVMVLHCSLYALIGLSQSQQPRSCIVEMNAVEMALRIIHEYDTISKKLAANLLSLLCADQQTREQVKMEDGLPLLLSQLHSDNVTLLWRVVWCLVLLSEDADCRDGIRQMGGIPLIISLLHERKFVSERTDASNEAVASAGTQRKHPCWKEREQEDFLTQQHNLKKACCTALTELVLNDANAQQIVQSNGIYSLGLLILPQEVSSDKDKKRQTKLQQNAFRALRFLFCMERNRRLFKHLFPPKLYEMFIDVGHYNRDLNAYKPLADTINSLSEESISEIKEHILSTHQNREPSFYIGDYGVFELLGMGAFGSVYKVRKKTGRQSCMALKEVNLQNTAFGKNAKEKAQSVGQITNELKIMKEEMRHPNVVRYYKTFELNDRLYIVMELIEGAPLGEHFTSLKEKNEGFSESRIWNILVQLILALRYLHKEKGIVHRDLTPNNIMLGENDKVTITDFGLAKQKLGDCSKMTSVVGTILYSCPEVVQNQAYGEKADIWALGCILYQMCVLEPPFNSNNMLTLVNKIVAGDYKPVPPDDYSAKLIQTVESCLTVSPEKRPDILELSGDMSNILLVHMDNLRISQTALERKLERERKRTQKHFLEANQNMQNYHRLFLASQDGYDKLTNLAGSGGAEGLKDEEGNEVFVDMMNSRPGNYCARSVSSIHLENASDEDSYQSSGSESRESSAGSVRSQHHLPTLALQLGRHELFKQGTHHSVLNSLEVEIPRSTKTSRDSGMSSGDLSPNTFQSSSSLSSTNSNNNNISPSTQSSPLTQSPSSTTASSSASSSSAAAGGHPQHHHHHPHHHLLHHQLSEVNGAPGGKQSHNVVSSLHRHQIARSFSTTEATANAGHGVGHKLDKRSRSAALLTISPNRLREINDPILQILHQLHKLISITQLPPTLHPNRSRRIIEQYKRALFAPSTSSANLKGEMKKLMQGSQDLIDLDFGPSEVMKRRSLGNDLDSPMDPDKPSIPFYDPDFKDVGITYEYLHDILESALEDSGYYRVANGVGGGGGGGGGGWPKTHS